MQYRVLALSALATVGLIAIGLSQTSPEPKQVVESISTADVEMAPAAPQYYSPAPAAQRVADRPQADLPQMEIPPPPSGEGTVPLGTPKIAYRFTYGFRVPGDAIKPLQDRHADLCESRGPSRCRIVAMEQAEDAGDLSSGQLVLAVAASDARAFGKALVGASGRMNGELVSSSIDGEDLSKAMVDTEARLRARTVLRDRLLEVLRNRTGTVKELVEAERSVAQVNEEIDQARGWLAEMRARVAFSEMRIDYSSAAPSSGGFAEPVQESWAALGPLLGRLTAVLLTVAATTIPLGVLIWLLVMIWRRTRLGERLATPAPQRETAEA